MTRTLILAVALLTAAAGRSGGAQRPGTGIDSVALRLLLRAAEDAHSDAVVVWKDGVGAWHFGREPRKIEAMSATKSIASLAVGRLVTTGAIASIDEPVFKEANGSFGQYIVVYPDQQLVAVRMMAASDKFDPATDGFAHFRELVRALAVAP